MGEDYVRTATLENENEARLLVSILKDRGVPHLLRSYHDTAFDGLFQSQKGWGSISAPETTKDPNFRSISFMAHGGFSFLMNQNPFP